MRRRLAESAGWGGWLRKNLLCTGQLIPDEAGRLVPKDPGVDMPPNVRKHDLFFAANPMAMLSIFNLVPSGRRIIEHI